MSTQRNMAIQICTDYSNLLSLLPSGNICLVRALETPSSTLLSPSLRPPNSKWVLGIKLWAKCDKERNLPSGKSPLLVSSETYDLTLSTIFDPLHHITFANSCIDVDQR